MSKVKKQNQNKKSQIKDWVIKYSLKAASLILIVGVLLAASDKVRTFLTNMNESQSMGVAIFVVVGIAYAAYVLNKKADKK